MTRREIRSNCGSLQDQPLHARLLNSTGLFLDLSWVTAYPETTDSGLPTLVQNGAHAPQRSRTPTAWGLTEVLHDHDVARFFQLHEKKGSTVCRNIKSWSLKSKRFFSGCDL